MSLRFHLRVNQGETFQLVIPVLDDNGDPVSLSGMGARGQIRAFAASPTALYEWSTTNGNLSFDGANVVITIPATASSAWTFRSGEYAVELADADGNVSRLLDGQVIIHPEVVR